MAVAAEAIKLDACDMHAFGGSVYRVGGATICIYTLTITLNKIIIYHFLT